MHDIIMYNDVQQANPIAYPLYIKEGQRYVCYHEGMCVSLRVQQVPQNSGGSSDCIRWCSV